MRKLVKIFFLIPFLFLPISNIFGIWTNVNSYNYSTVTQDIISHNNYLFATCGNTVVKSVNNGVTWSTVFVRADGLEFSQGQLISHLGKLFIVSWFNPYNKLISSSDNGQTWSDVSMLPAYNSNKLFSYGSNLILGTSQFGIYISTNSGVNWSIVQDASFNRSINGFTVLNSDIYCATSVGIYKSTNGGFNWSPSGLSQQYATYAITACNQNLIASADSSDSKKICVSTNSGASWISYSFQIYGMYSMTSIGNTAYIASFSNIYKSTNGGFNWTTLPSMSENINWVGSIGQRLYLGNNHSNVSYTDNEGQNWENKFVNMNKTNSIAQSGEKIYAATSNGVFVSPSSNQSWTQTPLNYDEVFGLGVSDNRVFAGTKNYGVQYSDDNGSSWTQSSLTNNSAFSFITIGDKIFAGTYSAGVYISTDNGINWTQTPLNNQTVHCFLSVNSNLFCGTENNGIFVSTNSGNSWTQTSYNNKTVYTLADAGVNLLAGTSTGGVVRSTDNGNTWLQFSLTGKTVTTLAGYSNYIFAGVLGDGFCISSNGGQSWAFKNTGEFGHIQRNPSKMIITNNNIVFLATYSTSVWQNTFNSIIGIQQVNSAIPDKFELYQNFPNPFNPNTKIKFNIPNSSLVEFKIYNSAGKEITTLVNGKLSSGSYEVNWNASDFPSGVYYYKIVSEHFNDTKKMVLIK